MKKMLLALTAMAAFTGSGYAADLPARMPLKAAPPPVVATSWTGCYLGAGGGGGMYTNDSYLVTSPPSAVLGVRASSDLTQGGRGWLATVQGGCDYQFAGTGFVIGAFADGDWTNIRGDHTGDQPVVVGLGATDRQTLNWQWAVGGRLGYEVLPSLLTFFTAGYTEAEFSGATYRTQGIGAFGAGPLTGDHINSHTYRGWFIGAGDEYSLAKWLPGLFWKTEYRYSRFDRQDIPVLFNATNLPIGFAERTRFDVQTVRSELVYRFNWGGPVVARY
jgi:outer membrane immunogenic protein